MGRNGQAKTKAQFTWEKVTGRVEKLYLELVAAKARGECWLRNWVHSQVNSQATMKDEDS